MTSYCSQVDVINEAVRLLLLYNKAWKQCARGLQVAVALLSRDVYVRRLLAFEKLLDEGSEI